MRVSPFSVIALFGPPGSGKSALIEYARSRGEDAVDAEQLGENAEERRKNFVALLAARASSKPLFAGAADLPPEAFPEGTRFFILLPSYEKYLARAKQRDALHAHKRDQEPERKWVEFEAMSKQFGVRIQNDGTVEETFDRMMSMIRA